MKEPRFVYGADNGEYNKGVKQLMSWKYRKDRRVGGEKDTAPSVRRKGKHGNIIIFRGSGFYAGKPS